MAVLTRGSDRLGKNNIGDNLSTVLPVNIHKTHVSLQSNFLKLSEFEYWKRSNVLKPILNNDLDKGNKYKCQDFV